MFKIKDFFNDVVLGKCVIFKKLNKNRRRFKSNDKSIVQDMIYEYSSCSEEEKFMLEINLIQKLEDNKMFSLIAIPLIFVPEIVDQFNIAEQLSGITVGRVYLFFYIAMCFFVIRTMERIKFQKTFLKVIEDMKNDKIKVYEEELVSRVKKIEYSHKGA